MEADEFVVIFEGKPRMRINENLVKHQGVQDRVQEIKNLHLKRLELEKEMQKSDDPDFLSVSDDAYTEIEFQLQDAWGFGRDITYHKFWERPKCKCPKLDNNEFYPIKYTYVSGGCPLHASKLRRKIDL